MNPYDAWASIYDDLYAAHGMPLLREDVPFYEDLAAAARGKLVVELGCGTGRLLLPLARQAAAGRGAARILGLDASIEMLRAARRKLAAEPDPVADRVRLAQADMTRFALARPAGLVIVAFRSLTNVPSQEGQIAALAAIRDALEPGGRAAIDLFFPDLAFLAHVIDLPREVACYVERGTGCRLVFTQRASFDPVAQTIHDCLDEERTWPDGRVEHRERRYLLRFPYLDEFRLMCTVAGLEVEDVFGWFDRAPLIGSSREMIFVLRKPASAR